MSTPISPNATAEDAAKAFSQLETDAQLGLLWKLYEAMGNSITPAAPGATGEQVTNKLLQQIKEMDEGAQLNFMRDLVNRTSTSQTKEYGAFTTDNKLVFWYELAELMKTGEVVPVPNDYELPEGAQQVFLKLSGLDFNQQITVLREAVVDMGAA
ncbi:MAG: Orange carotenoid protein [Leptolyngbya sp. SIO4C1]|nr:Orange carotenoid protein [Leptolyngbya sp. SIO4C1]